jgi:hypothetical protein
MMGASSDKRWLRRVLFTGVFYTVVGVTFSALAGSAGTNQARVMWRLTAWAASAIAFAAHLAYEQLKLRSSPLTTAWHCAMAVALGALGLAVAANLHALRDASSNQRSHALSLVLLPVLCGLPAFGVALAAAGALRLARRGHPSGQ